MARVVKTDVMKYVLANIVTTFKDGSSESVILGEGDVVNDLRIEIGNEVVYPLPDNPLVEEPENNDDNNN